MSETQPAPNRSFLIILLVVLVVLAIPMLMVFMILRSIRRAFRRLGGRRDQDVGSDTSIREARRRARKAKVAYEAANRKLQRASAKLAKAQAALDEAEGVESEEAPEPAAARGSSPAMFWFNVGKWLAKFLIERQMGKLA